MSMHLRYLAYVLRHKWFVFLAACRLGVPWLGVTHDVCKFSRPEWGPYARFFHGQEARPHGDGTGYCKPGDTGDPAFEAAWLHHVQSTRHHWQAWAVVTPEGGVSCHPVPDRYRREMLADWMGAGRAQGKSDTRAWYERNRERLHLHAETRAWLEAQLGAGAGDDGSDAVTMPMVQEVGG